MRMPRKSGLLRMLLVSSSFFVFLLLPSYPPCPSAVDISTLAKNSEGLLIWPIPPGVKASVPQVPSKACEVPALLIYCLTPLLDPLLPVCAGFSGLHHFPDHRTPPGLQPLCVPQVQVRACLTPIFLPSSPFPPRPVVSPVGVLCASCEIRPAWSPRPFYP